MKLPRAGLPPGFGPPPSPGGTRTIPAEPAHPGRRVSRARPTSAPFPAHSGASRPRGRHHTGVPVERRYSEVGLGSLTSTMLRDSPRYHAAVLGLSQFRHISWRSSKLDSKRRAHEAASARTRVRRGRMTLSARAILRGPLRSKRRSAARPIHETRIRGDGLAKAKSSLTQLRDSVGLSPTSSPRYVDASGKAVPRSMNASSLGGRRGGGKG